MRRHVALEVGGHAANGVHWFATANELRADGWRTGSPTEAKQIFTKLG